MRFQHLTVLLKVNKIDQQYKSSIQYFFVAIPALNIINKAKAKKVDFIYTSVSKKLADIVIYTKVIKA